MSTQQQDAAKELAFRLHMEQGCNGSMSCMFPADPFSWCTRPLASRLLDDQ